MTKWIITQGGTTVYETTNEQCSFSFPKNTGATGLTYTINVEDGNGCTTTKEMAVPAGESCQSSCSNPTPFNGRIEITASQDQIQYQNVTLSIQFVGGSGINYKEMLECNNIVIYSGIRGKLTYHNGLFKDIAETMGEFLVNDAVFDHERLYNEMGSNCALEVLVVYGKHREYASLPNSFNVSDIDDEILSKFDEIYSYQYGTYIPCSSIGKELIFNVFNIDNGIRISEFKRYDCVCPYLIFADTKENEIPLIRSVLQSGDMTRDELVTSIPNIFVINSKLMGYDGTYSSDYMDGHVSLPDGTLGAETFFTNLLTYKNRSYGGGGGTYTIYCYPIISYGATFINPNCPGKGTETNAREDFGYNTIAEPIELEFSFNSDGKLRTDIWVDIFRTKNTGSSYPSLTEVMGMYDYSYDGNKYSNVTIPQWNMWPISWDTNCTPYEDTSQGYYTFGGMTAYAYSRHRKNGYY